MTLRRCCPGVVVVVVVVVGAAAVVVCCGRGSVREGAGIVRIDDFTQSLESFRLKTFFRLMGLELSRGKEEEIRI